MSHSQQYFSETALISQTIDHESVERLVAELVQLRQRNGRLFLIGVGGSAANCSHAVNDFRKLNDIEAYAPTDNVSELTARTNDESWESVFETWLRTSRANKNDAIFIFSVSGGDEENRVSVNIVQCVHEAKKRGLKIFGIVGRSNCKTKSMGDEVIVIPNVNPAHTTPHAEAFQAVVWHALVSHPDLKRK